MTPWTPRLFAWQAWHFWHWAGSGGALGSQMTHHTHNLLTHGFLVAHANPSPSLFSFLHFHAFPMPSLTFFCCLLEEVDMWGYPVL